MIKSISFPDMFSMSRTLLKYDRDATSQNLEMLLKSELQELFGDPEFGTALRKFLFNQNDAVLQDLVNDSIYTAIAKFMPQLVVSRNDITLESVGTTLYVYIKGINQLDFATDLYTIPLLQN